MHFWILVVIAFIIAAACPAAAQEITGLAGAMYDYTKTRERTYSWQVEYLQGLGENFAYSISYVNEGHVTNHHRDGHAAQIWARTTVFDRHLAIAAGVGPFFYYDTTGARAGASWANDHGWGTLFSTTATWYTSDRWFFQLRSNWNQTATSFDTISLLAGIGYQLAPPTTPGPLTQSPPSNEDKLKNEVTLSFGRTIVNSLDSEPAYSQSIEYRRNLLPYMDWTISWMYEGENSVYRRTGLITQVWAVHSFFRERLSLGIGAGGYFITDYFDKKNGSDDEVLSGIVTLTGNYRLLDPHWGIRLSWNRIVTNYNRDADIITGGIGYHF
jgi:hypothetical protein